MNRSFSELKASVQKGSTPEQSAGTFVDGVLEMIETNRDDPTALDRIVKEGRESRQGLISALTHK